MTVANPSTTTTITALVTCDPGTVLLGGGGTVSIDDTDQLKKIQIIESRPLTGGPGGQWQVVAIPGTNVGNWNPPGPPPAESADVTVTAYALCSP